MVGRLIERTWVKAEVAWPADLSFGNQPVFYGEKKACQLA